ncbi:WecB/TagA/CpsF family glycosyltransferase [Arthrobacter sp. NPDC090010]|uniref:WecB/TagA/CpsF family glycosyltransferase n=1 Tax=Arthrobacter sp. NPDC090010 TaxID=3363942 RepID=UPI00381643B9
MLRQRVPLLGVEVTALTASEVIDELSRLIAEPGVHTVVGHNLHSVTLCLEDPGFARFYEQSSLILLDGAPVAKLWARAHAGGKPAGRYRVGSTDWLAEISSMRGLERLAVLGSAPAANAAAVEELRRRLPETAVEGHSGQDWDDAVEESAGLWLEGFAPQIVLVGLGMPLQERVIARLGSRLPAVYCAVGGAIEQLGGSQRLAPRWIGRLGFEWAWRLLFHPRRVAYRVFVEPWKLAWLLARRPRGGEQ